MIPLKIEPLPASQREHCVAGGNFWGLLVKGLDGSRCPCEAHWLVNMVPVCHLHLIRAAS